MLLDTMEVSSLLKIFTNTTTSSFLKIFRKREDGGAPNIWGQLHESFFENGFTQFFEIYMFSSNES